jgi:hypothetical protein
MKFLSSKEGKLDMEDYFVIQAAISTGFDFFSLAGEFIIGAVSAWTAGNMLLAEI